MRRLLSLLLVLVMLFSLSLTAFAEGEGGEGGGEGGGSENPPPHSHSYTETSRTPATCTTDGEVISTCSCGDTQTTTLAAPGHSWGTPSNSATCTAAGKKTYTCGTCGETKQEDAAALGHTWVAGTSTATCTQPGETSYTCSVCSGTKTEPAAATGHSFGAWSSVDATTHKRTCSKCGGAETGSHTLTSTSTATCAAAGTKTTTCTAGCGYIATESAPITNAHNWGNWTAADGKHSRTCSVCNAVEGPFSCSYSYATLSAATCTAEGKKIKKCSVCSSTSGSEEAIPKLDHKYDSDCDDECNTCKTKREAPHKYYNYYTFDAYSHWYKCSQCQNIKSKSNHVPGPVATEEKPQVCLTCGYEIVKKKEHKHVYDETQWKSDESGHWHVCEKCDMEVQFDDHNYIGDCGSGCRICGYENKNGHIYDNTYETDKRSHWQKCKVCGKASEPQDHIPGPKATASKPQTCTICDYEIAVYVEHDHVGGDWITNDAEHWKECECGEQLDKGIHAWDEGQKGKDNTLIRTCIDCGETMTELRAAKKTPVGLIILLVVLVMAFVGTLALLIKVILSSKNSGKFS